MDPKVSALERAFQLARSGQVASIDERTAREYAQIYRGLVRAEETHRIGKRNGVTESLIPNAQRSYRPILAELGTEVPNAAPAD